MDLLIVLVVVVITIIILLLILLYNYRSSKIETPTSYNNRRDTTVGVAVSRRDTVGVAVSSARRDMTERVAVDSARRDGRVKPERVSSARRESKVRTECVLDNSTENIAKLQVKPVEGIKVTEVPEDNIERSEVTDMLTIDSQLSVSDNIEPDNTEPDNTELSVSDNIEPDNTELSVSDNTELSVSDNTEPISAKLSRTTPKRAVGTMRRLQTPRRI